MTNQHNEPTSRHIDLTRRHKNPTSRHIDLTWVVEESKLKIARSDSSQNFIDTAKTVDLSRLCLQKTNTVVFESHTYQTYKEIQNKKHVNSKPKVLSNTMFRITVSDYGYLINRRTYRLGQ